MKRPNRYDQPPQDGRSKLLFTGSKGSPYSFLEENTSRLKNVRITRILPSRGGSGGLWRIFGWLIK